MTNVKIIEKKGKLKGPTIVILAGVHGNEKAGVLAIKNISLKLKLDKGKVIFIIANLMAFRENKRFIEKDLNRCFLEQQTLEIENSLEGRTAREIIHFLRNADFVLDIHQSNSEKSKPFIICDEKIINLTKFLPISTVTLGWNNFFPGASASFVNNCGGKGIAIELGSVKDQNCVVLAEKTIINSLSGLGFIDKKAEEFAEKEIFKIKKVHRNVNVPFKKFRDFDNFESLVDNCTIGKEGEEVICGDHGDIILFVRDRKDLNMECFIALNRICT